MQAIQYTFDEGVATITLNRPQARNALNATMTVGLDQLLNQIARDDTVLVSSRTRFCMAFRLVGLVPDD